MRTENKFSEEEYSVEIIKTIFYFHLVLAVNIQGVTVQKHKWVVPEKFVCYGFEYKMGYKIEKD